MKLIIFFLAFYDAFGLDCGRPLIKPSIGRIINGESAVPNSWPWVVSLRKTTSSLGNLNRNHICGGSVVSPDYVITAAHCVDGLDKDLFSVVIGSNYLEENNQLFYNISEIVIHPNYNDNQKISDIALLRLSERIDFSQKISSICLPDSSDVSAIFNQNVVVVGWGSTNGENNREKISNNLLQATLRIQNEVKPSICRDYDSFVYCALDPTPKKSNICFGDSGGPLMFNFEDKWFLYGTSSFVTVHPNNFSCANSDASYFVMIPNYIDWIRGLIGSKQTATTTTAKIILAKTTPRKSPKCGTPAFTPSKKSYRILYGQKAVPFSWPWMVSLRKRDLKHLCSGVLVDRQHLVTAAHCFLDTPASGIVAVLGINNLRQALKQRNKFGISKIFIHPNFDNRTGINDIAVFKLSKPVVYTRRIGPICLPKTNDYSIIYNQSAIIAGWGNTNGIYDGSLSNTLKQATMKVFNTINQNNCNSHFSSYYCTLDISFPKSNICFGDAGGPLMYELSDKKWYLFGVAAIATVDRNDKTCQNHNPSYFVKIPYFIEWIKKKLNE